ncbi:MAG: DUF6498-containing protein [Akkermansiaceae bacterium]|nr:DUF6498-containing protein [Akkermansiaceae bacterium]
MPDESTPAENPEQATARRADAGKEWVRDLIAFVGTVAAVMFFDWKARDVIWGLWICSLTFGYTTIVVTIFAPAVRAGGGAGAAMAFGGLFMLAFFTVHFGMFHIIHGQFLNSFFPLVEGSDGFVSPWIMIGAALADYWPLVLATFISRFSDLPLKEDKENADLKSMFKGAGKGGGDMMKPYANVIRMHLLIFVFAGLHGADMADLAIYPVLLFYFFPWGVIFGRRSKVPSS